MNLKDLKIGQSIVVAFDSTGSTSVEKIINKVQIELDDVKNDFKRRVFDIITEGYESLPGTEEVVDGIAGQEYHTWLSDYISNLEEELQADIDAQITF